MAVSLENTATATNITGGTTSFSTTMTVTSAVALLCMLSTNAFNTNTPTVTWDSGGTNQTMTLLNSSTGALYFYGLLNPTTGTKTIAGSWSGTANFGMGLFGLVGVATTSLSTTFTNFVTGSGTTSPTLTITSVSGNGVFAISFDGSTTADGTFSGTKSFGAYSNTNFNNNNGQYTIPSSGNTTFTYALGTSPASWFYAGIQAVAGSGSGPTLGETQRLLFMRKMVGWRRTLTGLLIPDQPAWQM